MFAFGNWVPKEDGVGYGKLEAVRACPKESPGLNLDLSRANLEPSTRAVLCRGSAFPGLLPPAPRLLEC